MQTFSLNKTTEEALNQLNNLLSLSGLRGLEIGRPLLREVYVQLKVNPEQAVLMFHEHLCKNKLIRLTDEEVKMVWEPLTSLSNICTKEKKLILKEEWSGKQKAIATMYNRKKQLSINGLWLTTYENFTFVVDIVKGKVYRLDNREKELIDADGCLYLKPILGSKQTLVYQDGEFTEDSSLAGLRLSKKRLSKSKQAGVTLSVNDFRSVTLYFRDHQIIMGMIYGGPAIDTFANGDVATHDINHRNRCPHDNRISNLEIITKSENRRHAVITDPLLRQRKSDLLTAMLAVVLEEN